ncbi:hypothetical protein Pan216_16220 [Planctomycetes bacterium Pan216]|uniref:Uncharacterized protein n=1 Tax=Kolteria novifilia TaxID=2527975 RepID=A0A518B1B7_9BACT|nr:hypothetical protein Pan216_16220 [Planctomycetes bacterium Pan216]
MDPIGLWSLFATVAIGVPGLWFTAVAWKRNHHFVLKVRHLKAFTEYPPGHVVLSLVVQNVGIDLRDPKAFLTFREIGGKARVSVIFDRDPNGSSIVDTLHRGERLEFTLTSDSHPGAACREHLEDPNSQEVAIELYSKDHRVVSIPVGGQSDCCKAAWNRLVSRASGSLFQQPGREDIDRYAYWVCRLTLTDYSEKVRFFCRVNP